jgi:RecB family exonuclease
MIPPIDITDIDLTPAPEYYGTTEPHLSFSQLSMFLRCSMQYFFRYVLGLKQRPNLPMAVGKGGHTALEYNGRIKMKTGDDLEMSDLLDAASMFIDKETSILEREDLAGNNPGDAKDRALAAIRVYRKRDAPLITPAGVEVEFNLDINDDKNIEPIRIINGKIDIITTTNAVDDYKFVRQAKTQQEVDISPQLSLYSKVFQTLTGKYPANVGFRMFLPGGKTTPPDVRLLRRDPALMTQVAQQRRWGRLAFQFRQVEQAIKSGVFIPTDDPRTCSWCGYRDRCQSSLVDDLTAARIRSQTSA